MMSLGPRVYGLSFEPLGERRCPQIIFEIPSTYAPAVEKALQSYVMRDGPREKARRYLQTRSPDFYLGTRSSDTKFGYLGCGDRSTYDDSVRFVLDLSRPKNTRPLALTVEVLLLVCESTLVEEAGREGSLHSNKRQLVSLSGRAVMGKRGLERHALWGSVSASVGRWLVQLADRTLPKEEAQAYSPELFAGWAFPDESVRDAMNLAYKHLAQGPKAKDICYATLKHSGHLAFGGFSQVAMFPDVAPEPTTDTGESVRMSCWNMDGNSQLLVMLAGLAAFHDVVVKELG